MRHSLVLFVIMCLTLPDDKPVVGVELECAVQPVSYSRLPESADLLLGDTIVLTVVSGTTAPVTISAYVEYQDERGKWRLIPATSYGKGKEFHSQDGNACAWGTMRNLPTETKITLFLPYRAIGFKNGKVKVRYRIRTITGTRVLYDATTDYFELEVDNKNGVKKTTVWYTT